jgi:NAD(P)-dependent dehydrogenase (short-subunit alcohol dehydrogenase family)
VTGAGKGIGAGTAVALAEVGADVVLAARTEADLRRTAELVEATGRRAVIVPTDVLERDQLERLVATARDELGRIDVLVNNAAIFATLEKGPFEQIPLNVWEKVMKVNITGVFLCTCAVAKPMREQGWGRIINIASDSVPKGVANYLHYVTSKAALIGMTNSMARELGTAGITVNCIRPGSVATEVDRTANQTVESRKRIVDMQCIPRVMVPTDLVGLVMFLSTPAASFITGQTIACDGGYTHSS